MKFQDYYETLGVSRDASSEEIRRAYRNLARKHHPDANQGSESSEEQFKKINEAYEVLKDPEKRKRYDQLGANWKHGQDFRPPPGYENFSGASGGFNFGDFSDFFEAFFGSAGRSHGPAGFGTHGGRAHRTAHSAAPLESSVEISLDHVVRGDTIKVTLGLPGAGASSFDIKIPKMIAEGKKIRLTGEGPHGEDILLKIQHGPGKTFRSEGLNLITDVRVSPAVAALGGKGVAESPDGPITVTIPPASSSGKRLRIRGKGFAGPGGSKGDLLVQVMVGFAEPLSSEEAVLYGKLKELEGA